MKTFTELERRELREKLEAAAGGPLGEPMPEFFIPAPANDGRLRAAIVRCRLGTPEEHATLQVLYLNRDPQGMPMLLISQMFWLN